MLANRRGISAVLAFRKTVLAANKTMNDRIVGQAIKTTNFDYERFK